MNMNKIFFSFVIVFTIALSSAFFTIITIDKLTTHTQKMYTHPFSVSNSISNIQTSIVTMHRNMKDVVLTKESLELLKIIEDIQREESKVFKNFDLIYLRYLGKKVDIDASYEAFKDWKYIRQEVISLVYQKRVDEAILITKEKGANYIENLYVQIDVLKDFAFNKANEYYQLSLQDEPLEQIILAYILTFLVGTFFVLYVVFTLLKNNKINNKQLNLIDQNILIAQISLNRKIIKISSALCCVLNMKKENLLNTECSNFFTKEDYFKKFENIIYSGKNYKGEVPIEISNEIFWYDLEIIPEFNEKYILDNFTILLTNISDKKQIEQVSITDTLTGLYNRNYFEIIFEKEIKRAKRENKELGVIMIDIDFFKLYNDNYGHQEGDKALKAVSSVIDSYTNRSYDYAFRVGGEEFVILTYQDDFVKLNKFTNSFIEKVEELQMPHAMSSVSKFVTISAGAIQFGDKNLYSPDEMYKKVDELLYLSKKNGRNKFKSLHLK